MNTHNETAKSIAVEIREMASPFNGITLEHTAEEISSVFVQAGINSKDAYLDWVASYKALISKAADSQRALRAAMKGNPLPYSEQANRSTNAYLISRLIEIRRASKIAAGQSRKADLEAA